MKSSPFLLFLTFFFADAVVFADAPRTEIYGFVLPSYMVSDQAISSFGGYSGGSWSRINVNAPTEAAPTFGSAFPKAARSGWSIGQSRFGAKYILDETVSGQAEIDFVDFDRSQATVAIRPRIRLIGLNYKINDGYSLFAGQDWDITAPPRAITYNYVANYFRAGNLGFFRPQIRIERRINGVERFAVMIGSAGINDAIGNDSAMERGVAPTFGMRLTALRTEDLTLGVSGSVTPRRYEDPATLRAISRLSYVGTAFANLAVAPNVTFGAGSYYGQNIQSTGSALTLSTGSFTGNQKEFGFQCTGKWKIDDQLSLSGGTGIAALVGQYENRIGTLRRNWVSKVAVGYLLHPKLDLFIEGARFDSAYTSPGFGFDHPVAVSIETGFVFKI